MRKITVVVVLCAWTLSAWAHPHMFIDTKVRLEMDGDLLAGIEMEWSFDQYFSASIVADYDENKNGIFEDHEIEEIRTSAFTNLSNYDYFTYISTGGVTYVPGGTQKFTTFLQGERLVYRFYIPVNLELIDRRVAIAIYDETFFCDIQYQPEAPVTVVGNNNLDWSIVERKDLAVSYGGSVSVARDGKNYSGISYPQQIVLTLQ